VHIEKKTLRNIFIGVISCIVIYWILHETERVKTVVAVIKGVISPFVLGACLAVILNVPMRAFERLVYGVKSASLRRLIAVLLTFIAVLLVLTLVFLLLIPQLSNTIQSLIPKLYSFISNSETFITEFLEKNPQVMEWIVNNTDFENLDWAGLAQKAISVLGTSVSNIMNGAFAAIGGITGAIMDAVIAIVFAIYCLFQKETLARQGRKLLYAFLSEKTSDNIIRVFRLTNSTFSNFLSGQCIEVCILGSLFAISMAIFKMPYIPLVSVLVAVTAFIPIVGAWVGCVLGAFFILVANPLQAVWFVVMFLILQQIENNLIYPRVVGTSIGLSGMWVLVAVAVGGELMGVAGMFLMIPIASVIHTLLREVTNKRLDGKEIPQDKLQAQPPELVSNIKQKLSNKNKAKKTKEEVQEESN
jgi:predicted PurR-regulated permease PerM